jgi:hypothetical protein
MGSDNMRQEQEHTGLGHVVIMVDLLVGVCITREELEAVSDLIRMVGSKPQKKSLELAKDLGWLGSRVANSTLRFHKHN